MRRISNKSDKIMLRTAYDIAAKSPANRLKVGAVIRSIYRRVVASGYNHPCKSKGDKCEDENNVTYPYVIHAEQEAICSAESKGYTIKGATMYVTAAPCVACANLIIASGINRVVYSDDYRDMQGVDLLRENGVKVEKFNFKE